MFSAAIDTAPGMAGFSLLKDGECITDIVWSMKGRDASKLSGFILDELAKHGVSLHDIDFWSVGSGPGSFTGLRQAAAMVAGWCFGRENVKSRCVPGAIALAAAARPEDGSEICCVYDGRNKEILYYNILFKDGDYHDTGKSGVLNSEQAEQFFREHEFAGTVCFSGEYEAIAKIIPDVDIQKIDAADASTLAKVRSIAFDNDLTRLVYIRPAVYITEK